MNDKDLEHNAQSINALVQRKLNQENRFVVERYTKNVLPINKGGAPEAIHRETFWYVHIGCLLTSQQRSSHDDPVPRFLREKPFPLSYEKCRNAYQAGNLAEFTADILQQYPGIRFTVARIPNAVAYNLTLLETDRGIRWKRLLALGQKLLDQRKQSPKASHFELENEAADYLDDRFKGFGSKQSRNFWQWLGLTRYVSVLDSRVKKWCVQNLAGDWESFEITRKRDYAQMSNLIRRICGKASVLPCMFDAAAFSEEETRSDAVLFCRGDSGDWDSRIAKRD